MNIIGEDEYGVRFVIGKPNKYLVTYEIEGELCSPVIETATQIFSKMDMDDCYDIHICALRWLQEFKTYDEMKNADSIYPNCVFHRTWHDPSDPLKMEIRLAFGTLETLDIGYGTNH